MPGIFINAVTEASEKPNHRRMFLVVWWPRAYVRGQVTCWRSILHRMQQPRWRLRRRLSIRLFAVKPG